MQKSKSGVFGSTRMAGLSMLHSVSWYFLNPGEGDYYRWKESGGKEIVIWPRSNDRKIKMPVTVISLVTGSAAWKTNACVIVIIKSWVKRLNIEFILTWGADTLIAFSSGRICRGRSARSCEVKIDVFIFKHSKPSNSMSEGKDSLL